MGTSMAILCGSIFAVCRGFTDWEYTDKFPELEKARASVSSAQKDRATSYLRSPLTFYFYITTFVFRTLAVECCYQNVGIATSVALTMFVGDEAASALAVPLFYGIVEVLLLGPYCILCWKAGWTKAPRNVPFWTMISTSYEVLLVEHNKDLEAVEVSLPKNGLDVNEKINRDGDTIYVKFSVSHDDEEDYQKVNCMCINLPSYPKEPSGYQLPEVPESEHPIEASGDQMTEVPELDHQEEANGYQVPEPEPHANTASAQI